MPGPTAKQIELIKQYIKISTVRSLFYTQEQLIVDFLADGSHSIADLVAGLEIFIPINTNDPIARQAEIVRRTTEVNKFVTKTLGLEPTNNKYDLPRNSLAEYKNYQPNFSEQLPLRTLAHHVLSEVKFSNNLNVEAIYNKLPDQIKTSHPDLNSKVNAGIQIAQCIKDLGFVFEDSTQKKILKPTDFTRAYQFIETTYGESNLGLTMGDDAVAEYHEGKAKQEFLAAFQGSEQTKAKASAADFSLKKPEAKDILIYRNPKLENRVIKNHLSIKGLLELDHGLLHSPDFARDRPHNAQSAGASIYEYNHISRNNVELSVYYSFKNGVVVIHDIAPFAMYRSGKKTDIWKIFQGYESDAKNIIDSIIESREKAQKNAQPYQHPKHLQDGLFYYEELYTSEYVNEIINGKPKTDNITNPNAPVVNNASVALPDSTPPAPSEAEIAKKRSSDVHVLRYLSLEYSKENLARSLKDQDFTPEEVMAFIEKHKQQNTALAFLRDPKNYVDNDPFRQAIELQYEVAVNQIKAFVQHESKIGTMTNAAGLLAAIRQNVHLNDVNVGILFKEYDTTPLADEETAQLQKAKDAVAQFVKDAPALAGKVTENVITEAVKIAELRNSNAPLPQVVKDCTAAFDVVGDFYDKCPNPETENMSFDDLEAMLKKHREQNVVFDVLQQNPTKDHNASIYQAVDRQYLVLENAIKYAKESGMSYADFTDYFCELANLVDPQVVDLDSVFAPYSDMSGMAKPFHQAATVGLELQGFIAKLDESLGTPDKLAAVAATCLGSVPENRLTQSITHTHPQPKAVTLENKIIMAINSKYQALPEQERNFSNFEKIADQVISEHKAYFPVLDRVESKQIADVTKFVTESQEIIKDGRIQITADDIGTFLNQALDGNISNDFYLHLRKDFAAKGRTIGTVRVNDMQNLGPSAREDLVKSMQTEEGEVVGQVKEPTRTGTAASSPASVTDVNLQTIQKLADDFIGKSQGETLKFSNIKIFCVNAGYNDKTVIDQVRQHVVEKLKTGVATAPVVNLPTAETPKPDEQLAKKQAEFKILTEYKGAQYSAEIHQKINQFYTLIRGYWAYGIDVPTVWRDARKQLVSEAGKFLRAFKEKEGKDIKNTDNHDHGHTSQAVDNTNKIASTKPIPDTERRTAPVSESTATDSVARIKEFAASRKHRFSLEDLREQFPEFEKKGAELVKKIYQAGYWLEGETNVIFDTKSGAREVVFVAKDTFAKKDKINQTYSPDHFNVLEAIETKGNKIKSYNYFITSKLLQVKNGTSVAKYLHRAGVFFIDGQFHLPPWLTPADVANFKAEKTSVPNPFYADMTPSEAPVVPQDVVSQQSVKPTTVESTPTPVEAKIVPPTETITEPKVEPEVQTTPAEPKPVGAVNETKVMAQTTAPQPTVNISSEAQKRAEIIARRRTELAETESKLANLKATKPGDHLIARLEEAVKSQRTALDKLEAAQQAATKAEKPTPAKPSGISPIESDPVRGSRVDHDDLRRNNFSALEEGAKTNIGQVRLVLDNAVTMDPMLDPLGLGHLVAGFNNFVDGVIEKGKARFKIEQQIVKNDLYQARVLTIEGANRTKQVIAYVGDRAYVMTVAGAKAAASTTISAAKALPRVSMHVVRAGVHGTGYVAGQAFGGLFTLRDMLSVMHTGVMTGDPYVTSIQAGHVIAMTAAMTPETYFALGARTAGHVVAKTMAVIGLPMIAGSIISEGDNFVKNTTNWRAGLSATQAVGFDTLAAPHVVAGALTLALTEDLLPATMVNEIKQALVDNRYILSDAAAWAVLKTFDFVRPLRDLATNKGVLSSSQDDVDVNAILHNFATSEHARQGWNDLWQAHVAHLTSQIKDPTAQDRLDRSLAYMKVKLFAPQLFANKQVREIVMTDKGLTSYHLQMQDVVDGRLPVEDVVLVMKETAIDPETKKESVIYKFKHPLAAVQYEDDWGGAEAGRSLQTVNYITTDAAGLQNLMQSYDGRYRFVEIGREALDLSPTIGARTGGYKDIQAYFADQTMAVTEELLGSTSLSQQDLNAESTAKRVSNILGYNDLLYRTLSEKAEGNYTNPVYGRLQAFDARVGAEGLAQATSLTQFKMDGNRMIPLRVTHKVEAFTTTKAYFVDVTYETRQIYSDLDITTVPEEHEANALYANQLLRDAILSGAFENSESVENQDKNIGLQLATMMQQQSTLSKAEFAAQMKENFKPKSVSVPVSYTIYDTKGEVAARVAAQDFAAWMRDHQDSNFYHVARNEDRITTQARFSGLVTKAGVTTIQNMTLGQAHQAYQSDKIFVADFAPDMGIYALENYTGSVKQGFNTLSALQDFMVRQHPDAITLFKENDFKAFNFQALVAKTTKGQGGITQITQMPLNNLRDSNVWSLESNADLSTWTLRDNKGTVMVKGPMVGVDLYLDRFAPDQLTIQIQPNKGKSQSDLFNAMAESIITRRTGEHSVMVPNLDEGYKMLFNDQNPQDLADNTYHVFNQKTQSYEVLKPFNPLTTTTDWSESVSRKLYVTGLHKSANPTHTQALFPSAKNIKGQ